MLKEHEKPIENVYTLTESELRENVRRALWEYGISKLLKEYAGGSDAARELTTKIAKRIAELRPFKKENDFLVYGPDGKDLFISILSDENFVNRYGVVNATYIRSKRNLVLRMSLVNDDNYLSYIYESLMHELTHVLQFKTAEQIRRNSEKLNASESSFVKEIGYMFNPYEIGARIGSADFYFRSFIEASGLRPDDLRKIQYRTITNTFHNSLMIDGMEKAIREVEDMVVSDTNAETFAEICNTLSDSTRQKANNTYQEYMAVGQNNMATRQRLLLKLRNMALSGMKKRYKDYTERLQKLWEYLITNYNGEDFEFFYIN